MTGWTKRNEQILGHLPWQNSKLMFRGSQSWSQCLFPVSDYKKYTGRHHFKTNWKWLHVFWSKYTQTNSIQSGELLGGVQQDLASLTTEQHFERILEAGHGETVGYDPLDVHFALCHQPLYLLPRVEDQAPVHCAHRQGLEHCMRGKKVTIPSERSRIYQTLPNCTNRLNGHF